MLDWLELEIGVELARNSRLVSGGASVVVDGMSSDPPVLCEAYGRLGYVAGTTLSKACHDAAKVAWLRDHVLDGARTILLIANDDLKAKLTSGNGWRASMIRDLRVEVIRANLHQDQVQAVHLAEERARQGMIPPIEAQDEQLDP